MGYFQIEGEAKPGIGNARLKQSITAVAGIVICLLVVTASSGQFLGTSAEVSKWHSLRGYERAYEHARAWQIISLLVLAATLFVGGAVLRGLIKGPSAAELARKAAQAVGVIPIFDGMPQQRWLDQLISISRHALLLAVLWGLSLWGLLWIGTVANLHL